MDTTTKRREGENLDGVNRLKACPRRYSANIVLLWGNNEDGQLGFYHPTVSGLCGELNIDEENDCDQNEKSEDGACLRSPHFLHRQESMQQPFSKSPEICTALKGIRVVQVSCGSRHTLAMSAQGAAYSWGWGACGQLGHGDNHSLARPRIIEALSLGGSNGMAPAIGGADTLRVSVISAGGIHSAAVVEGGAVYSWGGSSYGQLGLGPGVMAQGILTVPGMVMMPPDGALVPLVEKGNGGNAEETPPSPRVVRAKLLTRASGRPSVPNSPTKPFVVTAVSCGGMHTAAVTPKGEVYCWGRADSGQLGIGYEWIHETAAHVMGVEWPSLVMGPLDGKRTVSVACGGFHTAAVTEEGCVYTWGKEEFGMLGCSNETLLKGGLTLPHLVTVGKVCSRKDTQGEIYVGSQRAAAVACGGWHTAAITEDGTLWTCGRGEYGRLGLGDETSQWLLKPVPLGNDHHHHTGSTGGAVDDATQVLDPVVQTCLGGSHTLVLTKAGRVYSFGRQDHGRLGTKEEAPNRAGLVPTEVSGLGRPGWKVESLSCGGGHSAAILVQDCDN